VLVGSAGTIASYDYAPVIHLQTRANPETHDIAVDVLSAPHDHAINHFLHCLETDETVIGPLDPQLCRLAQRIVDSAMLSSQQKRTVALS
jgi:glucose-fructose oxidoreductase